MRVYVAAIIGIIEVWLHYQIAGAIEILQVLLHFYLYSHISPISEGRKGQLTTHILYQPVTIPNKETNLRLYYSAL